ncbi:hypothetical protein Tco_0475894 [Tanacetum coccineum]
MKEIEVNAIKEIEKWLKEKAIQQQESLVTEGTPLEANLSTNDISLDVSLVTEAYAEKTLVDTVASDIEYADIGPSYDSDTVSEVHHDTFENVFAHGIQNYEQPESIPDTYVVNENNSNIIFDIPNMDPDRGQTAQTLHTLLPKQDNVYMGKQALGFENQNDVENPFVLNKAKELAPNNVKRIARNRLSEEFEPLVKDVNLQLKCFEKGLVKEMKDDLKYVTSLEDEFDDTYKKFDKVFQKIESMKKKMFDSRISNDFLQKYLYDYDPSSVESESGENKILFRNKTSSFETKIKELEMTLAQQIKDFKDAKGDFSKKTEKFETYFEKLENAKLSLNYNWIARFKILNPKKISKENGKQFYDSVINGPLQYRTVEVLATPTLLQTTRQITYEDLTKAEKIHESCDIRATNIVLQYLPPDVYSLVNYHIVSKEIWDKVKLLIKGSELSLQERESNLYNEFDTFTSEKGETIHSYYLRFS